MALHQVQDIKLFKASTGHADVDTVLDQHLLHLQMDIDGCEPFIMSSIPTYIGKTLMEHTQDLPYSSGIFTLLNKKRSTGKPLKRIQKVALSIKSDNSSCKHRPLKMLWCDCGQCTSIDMSIYVSADGKEWSTDVFTGLLLSVMFHAPVRLNNHPIQHVKLVQIRNMVALLVDHGKEIYLVKPPESVVSFFSQYEFKARRFSTPDQRLSIEAVATSLSKTHDEFPLLQSVKIADLQDSGTYIAEVEFEDCQFKMIPSHAVLLAFLLDGGNIFVDSTLLQQKS